MSRPHSMHESVHFVVAGGIACLMAFPSNRCLSFSRRTPSRTLRTQADPNLAFELPDLGQGATAGKKKRAPCCTRCGKNIRCAHDLLYACSRGMCASLLNSQERALQLLHGALHSLLCQQIPEGDDVDDPAGMLGDSAARRHALACLAHLLSSALTFAGAQRTSVCMHGTPVILVDVMFECDDPSCCLALVAIL